MSEVTPVLQETEHTNNADDAPASGGGSEGESIDRAYDVYEHEAEATRIIENATKSSTPEYDTALRPSGDESNGANSGVPPGAPFPDRLFVSHRWDIGETFYDHILWLLDWIENKLLCKKEEDLLGEDFMLPEGSKRPFAEIWELFFDRMILGESMGLIERLQYGLKVRKEAHRIQGCLEFTWGVGAPPVFAAFISITSFIRKHGLILSGRTLHHLRGLHALLSLDAFPKHTIVVPAFAESHSFNLHKLDPQAQAVRPYIPASALKRASEAGDSKTEKGALHDYGNWRRRAVKGIRVPDEDLVWAPSKGQIGMTIWDGSTLASIVSQSMLSEFEHFSPSSGTPFLYRVTGIPEPMEWDYREWNRLEEGNGDEEEGEVDPETLPVLQHYVAHDELPDVLLVDDPDQLTMPSQTTHRGHHEHSDAEIDEDDEEGDEEIQGTDDDDRNDEVQDGEELLDEENDSTSVSSNSSHASTHSNTRSHRSSSTASDPSQPAPSLPDASSSNTPTRPLLRYRRVHPLSHGAAWADPPPSPSKPPAYLSLSYGYPIGEGRSGRVWNGVIDFGYERTERASSSKAASSSASPPPQHSSRRSTTHISLSRDGAPLPPKLSVAAKLPYTSTKAHTALLNEAKMYALFPESFSRPYNGYTMAPRARGWKAHATGAMVPKFYGYYVPDVSKGKGRGKGKGKERERRGEKSRWRKPILLVEKCGLPVTDWTAYKDGSEDSVRLCEEHKSTIFAMLQRLHYVGFTQNSFSVRNILMQPGPLALPPAERSLEHPSFRIIDFGSGYCNYYAKPNYGWRYNGPSLEESDETAALELFGLERY